jgi:hypothetical protein
MSTPVNKATVERMLARVKGSRHTELLAELQAADDSQEKLTALHLKLVREAGTASYSHKRADVRDTR